MADLHSVSICNLASVECSLAKNVVNRVGCVTWLLNIVDENDAINVVQSLGKLMKVFNDELDSILTQFNEYMWDEPA